MPLCVGAQLLRREPCRCFLQGALCTVYAPSRCQSFCSVPPRGEEKGSQLQWSCVFVSSSFVLLCIARPLVHPPGDGGASGGILAHAPPSLYITGIQCVTAPAIEALLPVETVQRKKKTEERERKHYKGAKFLHPCHLGLAHVHTLTSPFASSSLSFSLALSLDWLFIRHSSISVNTLLHCNPRRLRSRDMPRGRTSLPRR